MARAAGLVAGGFTLRRGCLLGAGTPLLTPEDKARVFAETGASVVDMESDAVARVAMEVGLPWVALRVVADPAGLALPALAARSIKPDGRVDLAGLLCGLARRPGQIGGFLALARSGRKALGVLRRVAALGLFFEPL